MYCRQVVTLYTLPVIFEPMKYLSLFYNVIKNKYILSLVVFVVWISFFDRNDLITQWERKKELQKVETSKAYYETEISATRKELSDLDQDSRILEKMAREKFYLKRPNEDLFLVIDSTELIK